MELQPSQSSANAMEEVFWSSLHDVPHVLSPAVPSMVHSELSHVSSSVSNPNDGASKLVCVCPEEEIWVPSDQTLHWGKRPNYNYPSVKLLDKDDLPNIPRGNRLVAKLWYSEWEWDEERLVRDENGKRPNKPDPNNTPCFEEEKTMVPFEKGVASFRHLRISKSIKLKKTETFTILTLGFEVGYHDPFARTPFKSLEIFLTKSVKIHIVAHKGSVKLMQKYGLLDTSVRNGTGVGGDLKEEDEEEEEKPLHKRPIEEGSSTKAEPLNKRHKADEVEEILAEISNMQSRMDELKNRITVYAKQIPHRPSIRYVASDYAPSTFIFYAFRTKNLSLAITIMQAFPFDINSKDIIGYTCLHSAARASFVEGVKWCLTNSASVNAITEQRMTALHLAYVRNDKEVRRILKEGKADKEAANCFGLKPKDYRNDRKSLMRPTTNQTLVEIVIPGLEQYPFPISLWYAVRIGWMEVVSAYLNQIGFDVDSRNNAGQTPLMCACEYKQLNVAKYLLEMGADPNSRDVHDHSPLHYAYMNGPEAKELGELLCKYGADSNVLNIWQRSPSWYRTINMNMHRNTLSFSASLQPVHNLFRSLA